MGVGFVRVASRLMRLDIEQVRRLRFRRTGFGRRGLAEEQVYAFLRHVVDELVARDAVEAGLREENARLKSALRDWQSRFVPPQPGRGATPPGERGRTGR